MKSKDFQINEAINWFGKGPMFVPGADAEQKTFISNFIQQFNLDRKAHPNVPIDNFMDQYFQKNGWDINKLAPAYKQSLQAAIKSTATNPQNVGQLATSVYTLAKTLQAGNESDQDPADGDGQLNPNTNQIITKIRSIKNSPEEIDDLVDIIAISMFKLYKIAPKNYKRIVMSLFNNGGRPSMPAANNVAPQTKPTPTQQSAPAAAPVATAATQTTPNYSSTNRVAPGKVTYNTTKSVTPTTQTAPTMPAQTSTTSTPTPTRGRNVEFTGQGLGRIEPINTDAAKKISQNSLDKRINARGAAQAAITTRAGLPK